MTVPSNSKTSTEDELTESPDRIVGHVEATNRRFASDDAHEFDFEITSDDDVDGRLGLLVSYLAAAAVDQSAALGLSVDIRRIVLAVEQPAIRSDGGTTPSEDSQGETVAKPTQTDSPDQADAPTAASGTRVTARMEVYADQRDERLAAWEKRLRADETPAEIAPELVALDFDISTR